MKFEEKEVDYFSHFENWKDSDYINYIHTE